MSKLRQWLSERFRKHIESRVSFSSDEELRRSAMIFAPHQNDETLGCGGTIIRKRAMQVDVDVVFLTDGSRSHSHLISHHLLAELRAEEAKAACEKLGVAPDRISFLRCRDGYLGQAGHLLVPEILALICDREPEEIYIPYAWDPQADHVASNQLIRTILQESGISATIMEYPIWVWYQWPWVQLHSFAQNQATQQIACNSTKVGAGLRITCDLNYGISTDGVHIQKHLALKEHRTQMTRYNADPRWLTLHDIAQGDWLKHVLHTNEMFRTYCV